MDCYLVCLFLFVISLKPGSDGEIRNATMVSTIPFSTDVSYFEIGLY